jgi:hypothetical protein
VVRPAWYSYCCDPAECSLDTLLFNLGYKLRASGGVMLPCFYYIEFTGIIVFVL